MTEHNFAEGTEVKTSSGKTFTVAPDDKRRETWPSESIPVWINEDNTVASWLLPREIVEVTPQESEPLSWSDLVNKILSQPNEPMVPLAAPATVRAIPIEGFISSLPRQSEVESWEEALINLAIEYEREVTISYNKPGRDPELRDITPSEIIETRNGAKLVIADDVDKQDVRSFRLDRIIAVEV